MSFLDEYAAFCARHGRPRRLEAMLIDLNAILRGKWLAGEDEAKLAGGEVRLPLSTHAPNILGAEVEQTGLGIVVGDPDGHLLPVPGTLAPVPWAPGSAQVIVDLADAGGAISALSPRQRLADVLGRFAARGLRPVVATELEFYLFEPRAHEDEPPTPPPGTPEAQNYELDVLARREALLDAIRAGAEAQGLAPDTLIAEYGPGQFEINFHHTDDALRAADDAVIFRRLVRATARAHGLEATFMAKPYAEHPGNGMHAHVSVIDEAGRNIFDHDGEGLSPTLGQAIAGTLDAMAPLQAVFAPHLNSYRRFQPESFAPHRPDWGFDNRAAAVRVPQSHGPGARLEHRISGADVNPHLALAAILGSILHGLEAPGLALPPPLEAGGPSPAEPLTADWAQAVETFATSELAAQIFTPAYRDIYVAVRHDEIARLTREISPIEYRTYLGRL